jgi:hypothetical protein
MPMQPPETHALLPQSAGVPHCPVASHVCTPLPEHWVVPAAHMPEPSAPAPSTVLSLPGESLRVPSSVAPPSVVASKSASSDPPSVSALASLWPGPGPPWFALLHAASTKPARRAVDA